jgi:hypothetical protein
MSAAKTIRCTVYTRKSSEEGLDQDFNSLHAQREVCAAYIQSQRQEGWRLLPTQYDDGGYSGGTLERPALQQLLADIRKVRASSASAGAMSTEEGGAAFRIRTEPSSRSFRTHSTAERPKKPTGASEEGQDTKATAESARRRRLLPPIEIEWLFALRGGCGSRESRAFPVENVVFGDAVSKPRGRWRSKWDSNPKEDLPQSTETNMVPVSKWLI